MKSKRPSRTVTLLPQPSSQETVTSKQEFIKWSEPTTWHLLLLSSPMPWQEQSISTSIRSPLEQERMENQFFSETSGHPETSVLKQSKNHLNQKCSEKSTTNYPKELKDGMTSKFKKAFSTDGRIVQPISIILPSSNQPNSSQPQFNPSETPTAFLIWETSSLLITSVLLEPSQRIPLPEGICNKKESRRKTSIPMEQEEETTKSWPEEHSQTLESSIRWSAKLDHKPSTFHPKRNLMSSMPPLYIKRKINK